MPNNVGQHFALVFDDLGAAVAELRARGLKVSDPVAVGTTGRQQAFTADPWGNGIELHQRRLRRAPPRLTQSVRMLTCLRPRRSPNFTTPSAVAKSVSSPPRPTLAPG